VSDKTDLTEIKETIRQQALNEGFDVCGFGPPQIPPRNQERYRTFIEKGEHASMAWLENRLNQRVDPQALWDQVQSVMVVGQNYAPSDEPKKDWARRLADPAHAHISAYARGRDYHDVLKKRLKRVGRWLCQEFASLGADVKVFVDTAPIPEKALAQMAGVGWQGKHTNLVNRDYGSYLFLGVMYLSLPLPPDPAAPHADQCGTCTACIDICPTDAIEVPYQLNASKCIAYWNIEHKGDDPIPAPIAKAMGNRVFGCDDCLAVCPWNKFAQHTTEPAFEPQPATNNATIEDVLALNDQSFRDLFAQTPVKRVGSTAMQRNLRAILTNRD